MEEQDQTRMLVERLQENKKSLHIARVPDKTKIDFVTLADTEFCSDYGMTLKWLMDDLMGQDTKMIISKLEEHEDRLNTLESKSPLRNDLPKSSGRKMLDGSIKSIRGSEKNE